MFIEESESELVEGMKVIQLQLWQKVDQLIRRLRTEEGRISNKATNYSLLAQLNKIQNEIKDGPKRKLIRKVVQNLIEQEGKIKSYFKEMMKLEVSKVSTTVRKSLLDRIGYDGKGFVKNGQLFDLWNDDTEIRAIRAQTIKAIAGGKSWGQFQDEISNFIKGAPGPDGKAGVTEAHFRTATMDIYSQNDRSLTRQYAVELDIKKYIMQGGLMKTTRDFCRARNNKVFTEEQIEAWKNLSFDGKPSVYDPFLDVGGYNCRHVLDPINDELAEELLAEQEAEQAPVDPEVPEELDDQQQSNNSDVVRNNGRIDPSTVKDKGLQDVEDLIREQDFESAAIYLNGKQTLFKNGGSNFVEFTEDEARSMKDGVFTHNHPSSRSFSKPDLNMFWAWKPKEFRAISMKYNYSMMGNIDHKKYPFEYYTLKYDEFNREIRERNLDLIMDEKMTVDQAEATHYHELNTKMAEFFGFTYKRTPR